MKKEKERLNYYYPRLFHIFRSQTHLQTLAVHENLLHKLRLNVNVLNLLGYNIFALAQLENVLLAINNLESSIWKPLADVP